VRDRLRAQPRDPVVARHPAPAPDVLTLLRQAGNQATGRALARARETARADEVLVVDGLGEIPLQSFHVDRHVVSVMFAVAAAGPELERALATGAPLATVVIKSRGHTVTLRDVVVASFRTHDDTAGGPPLADVEFNGRSVEFQ
jgi:hypothetical protein